MGKENGKARSRAESRFLRAAFLAGAVLAAGVLCHAVPSRTAQQAAPPPPLQQSLAVDINHATLQQLCTLPGIGEKKAQALLSYRARHGSFATVEQAVQVPGITEAIVAGWGQLAYAG